MKIVKITPICHLCGKEFKKEDGFGAAKNFCGQSCLTSFIKRQSQLK